MSISRRGALLGASAAVAVAGVPTAVAAQACDANLMALVEQFHDVYGQCQDVWEKQRAHRAEIEARPDCPPVDLATCSRAHFAFLDANDAFRYCDQSNRLGEQTGALANAIFEAPAKTARGVLEKVRILHVARGDYDQDGDDELDACQDNSWFGHVITDLERLAGESRPT